MGIGVAASFFAFEPAARRRGACTRKAPLWTPRGFFDAVVGPFVDFFATHKALGLLMLAAIAAYRLPDFLMGPMYNPYYHDLGLTKDAVAVVRGRDRPARRLRRHRRLGPVRGPLRAVPDPDRRARCCRAWAPRRSRC